MLWLTRDGTKTSFYCLWETKPSYEPGGARWELHDYKLCRTTPPMGSRRAKVFHRKYANRLAPGKDGICRVDMALTRRD